MANASTSVDKFDSVVRGQNVYKSAQAPLTHKTRKCTLQEANDHDKYAVDD